MNQLEPNPRCQPRREVLLRAWCLIWLIGWQGGFAFYSGVVVPLGAEVLGSDLEQGLVTRAVTPWLNGIGWTAVVSTLAALSMTSWRPSMSGPTARSWKTAVGFTLYLMVTLMVLGVLYRQVDQYVDPLNRQILDYDTFYALHRVYLIVSASQWLSTLVLASVLTYGWMRGEEGTPRQII